MSSRFLRWGLIAFTCVWFGAFVPAHTRGQIKLAGATSIKTDRPESSACSKSAHCHKKTPAAVPNSDSPTPQGDTRDCAVCHLILGLHTPPPVASYEVKLGL